MIENILNKAAEKHCDYTGSKMGMWIFLYTEMLLFGGMFLVYAVYRYDYPQEFHLAAQELDVTIGSINTLILLTSSLTMALSVAALQKGKKQLSLVLQVLTMLLGAAFLVNKYVEWGAKFYHGIYPNSETLLSQSKGSIMFYGLYFVMTGIHGLHVLIGMGVFLFMIVFTVRGSVSPANIVKLENSGLYWHFVDIVWVYLFPLFYLIT
ncbi:MAG: cytochrome C oxidase subunit III [Nitrospira bacterium SG8_35_4]|nr:MAG: cytochrome C oxidase subunit III [Nitrospira bacterium SG8_35_4]